MVAFHGGFNTVTQSGSNYGYYGLLIAAGKIDTVTFTLGADDPCHNCRLLKDEICQDQFTTPESIAHNKGFARKNVLSFLREFGEYH